MSTLPTAAFDPKTKQRIELVVIDEFLLGGPKDGNSPTITTTEEISEVTFSTWSPRRNSYERGSHVSNKLYWNACVQTTWATSVERRGIASVDGHPILFARKLYTKNFDTFEVVALKRGAGFTATAVRGFVLRLNQTAVFDEDWKRALKRFRKKVRTLTVAMLEGECIP